ncbi:succinylglutamate desuccinylase/aspartoacylase family protein [Acidisphaera sp. L21]|uniref:succinylglutamate desuccinylase/aspartoacylase domain-containing protein n=1 Tax=Acidisphaera sp. L21 TaxID=1641851 RepID=UPI00131E2215|nr:succinylglutamate desuccinylase/aspartoacylase family protein [Acidisphaera sp. L21]
MTEAAAAGMLPHFPVEVSAPDISAWTAGNTGVPGFTTLASGKPGPHVGITGLMHGNELAGAIVLEQLLRSKFVPRIGKLTVGFANLAAFARFDPAQPTASRFVDEDLNRLWDPVILNGLRRSSELDRARAMRPLIDQMDMLLDIHSMLWPSDPLILSGPTAKGRALGRLIGIPPLVIADHGHVSGPRLIDYARFTGPGPAAAVLVEAGQHWEQETVICARACLGALLRQIELEAGETPRSEIQIAEVTLAVTAATTGFAFVRNFRGGQVIPARNTLIALDGNTEIRTPHDDCMLVMPSLRPSRGHTAVRLARLL